MLGDLLQRDRRLEPLHFVNPHTHVRGRPDEESTSHTKKIRPMETGAGQGPITFKTVQPLYSSMKEANPMFPAKKKRGWLAPPPPLSLVDPIFSGHYNAATPQHSP